MSNTSSNKSSIAEYHEPADDQQKKRRSTPKFDKPTVAIHSSNFTVIYQINLEKISHFLAISTTSEMPSSEYQTASN